MEEDLKLGFGYVAEMKEKVVAVAALVCRHELIYDGMNEGNWLTHGTNYMAIHRLVVNKELKRLGIATFIFQ